MPNPSSLFRRAARLPGRVSVSGSHLTDVRLGGGPFGLRAWILFAVSLWMGSAFWNGELAAGIQTSTVFDAGSPTGKYKHAACVEELDNGDFFLVFYSGEGEYEGRTKVFGSRLAKGSSQWTAPRPVAEDPFHALGNAVVWQAPDRALWLFYVVRFGKTWDTSRIAAKISNDRGQTWSDSSLIALEEGFMVRNRPIVLRNGDYFLPIYHEVGADTEAVGPDCASLFLRKEPASAEWIATGRIRHPNGNIQPAAVQLSDNRLIALCRRGGGYEPTDSGYMVYSESRDGGETWAKGRDFDLPNPNAALDLLRLKSGNLLLVYNHSMSDRTPLTAALSLDEGKTFSRRKNLAEGEGSFAYPTAIQSRDGTIHVVYTAKNRTSILHARFEESDLMNP